MFYTGCMSSVYKHSQETKERIRIGMQRARARKHWTNGVVAATGKAYEDRFYSYVRKHGHPKGCWVWTGQTDKDGYGTLGYKGKKTRAHRIAWIFVHGSIPDGLFVLHACDNPSCVNVDHLFTGNSRSNVDDMISKGRNAKGDTHWTHLYPERRLTGDRNGVHKHPECVAYGYDHPKAKLTTNHVRVVKSLYRRGNHTQQMLASMFSVSQVAISLIIRGKNRRRG